MKNITVAICIDERGGMLFNHRRQTSDVQIIDDMVERFGENGVFIKDFYAKLFQKYENVTVSSFPISECSENALCFIENPEILNITDDVERIVVYNWCKSYPADEYFTLDLIDIGFIRISKEKFSTEYRQKVTREVFKRA